MFSFTFVLYEFEHGGIMGGPLIQSNLNAKWLSDLAPPDLDISFAPIHSGVPFYHSNRLKLMKPGEATGWIHYSNDIHWPGTRPQACSFGPSLTLTNELSIPAIERYQIPLVTISEYSKGQVLEGWDYPSELVTVIPAMIDPAFRPGPKSEEPIVGWIGYDNEDRWVKGCEVIPYLAERFPQIQFEMVHASPPKFQHEWMPRALPNVKIYTKIPHEQMPQLIQRWHVLVSGSKHETGATHAVEAMACGVPVICANVAGQAEAARGQIRLDGLRKWHKYPFDWTKASLQKFGDALEGLLTDGDLYEEKVQAALKKSAEQHPELVARRWFEFMYKCRELRG